MCLCICLISVSVVSRPVIRCRRSMCIRSFLFIHMCLVICIIVCGVYRFVYAFVVFFSAICAVVCYSPNVCSCVTYVVIRVCPMGFVYAWCASLTVLFAIVVCWFLFLIVPILIIPGCVLLVVLPFVLGVVFFAYVVYASFVISCVMCRRRVVIMCRLLTCHYTAPSYDVCGIRRVVSLVFVCVRMSCLLPPCVSYY